MTDAKAADDRPGKPSGSTVARERPLTSRPVFTTLPSLFRRRSQTCASAASGFTMARRVSKNVPVAPSAKYRLNASLPRGCVPATYSSALLAPSPSGSPELPSGPVPTSGRRPTSVSHESGSPSLSRLPSVAGPCVTVAVWAPAVIVAVRGDVDRFGSARVTNVVLPAPPCSETESHWASVDAAQLHPSSVVSDTSPCPPVASNVSAAGASEKEHAWASWDTATVSPATLTVDVRGEVAVFAGNDRVTRAESLSLVEEAKTHDASDELAHVHPGFVDTDTVAVVASLPSDRLVGVTKGEQGAWDCFTVNLLPATVTVAVRFEAEFGPTVTVSVRPPVPLAGETVVQPALEEADHGQPEVVVKATDVVPPPLAMVADAGEKGGRDAVPA